MRKSIKEAITSTGVDMLKSDLEVSDELIEHMDIAKIVEEKITGRVGHTHHIRKLENNHILEVRVKYL